MRTIEDIALHIERNIKDGTIIDNVEILSAELEKTIDFYINVAKKLDVPDAIKAMDCIFGQCIRARSKIANKIGDEDERLYPIYEAEFGSYYVKNKDRILESAEEMGMVTVVNGAFGKGYSFIIDNDPQFLEYNDAYNVPTCFNSKTMDSPLFDKCLKLADEPWQMICDMWVADYYKNHLPDIAPIINVLYNGEMMAEGIIDRLYFEYDFLVKAGVCPKESIDKYKVFSDFIDCEDEKIVELLSTRISRCTALKSIAITLMAIIQLKQISIDKINRHELYESIRRINNTKFGDTGINYYVSRFIAKSLSYPIRDAINLEVEAIKKLLV